jgi:hypothetical protein
MIEMRERLAAAKKFWTTIRNDFRADLRFVSGEPADQWDPAVKNSRDDENIPALTLDTLNPDVNAIVNRTREDRPQPKVAAADGGTDEAADLIEDKLRHCLYESHADVAFDYCQAYCTSGGFAFVRVEKEWVGKGYHQEPRVRRVEDPLSILFDPSTKEIDYSDAEWCFEVYRITREQFVREFPGKEPVPVDWEDNNAEDWGGIERITVARYWWIEKNPKTRYLLIDGTEGEEGDGHDPTMRTGLSREEENRIVHCDTVDGQHKLKEEVWDGEWIPIVPQIAQERISDGQKRYVSFIRYRRDPQILTNASGSAIAERMAQVNSAPWIGPRGTFKNPMWRDGKRHSYMEWEPVMVNGTQQPPPERNAFEPAIQGPIASLLQAVDAGKRAAGYVDAVTEPSQQDLSGIAIDKRAENQSASNFQYEDSLKQMMWHLGRIMVDLLKKLTDTPRIWTVRKEDGTSYKVPVTVPVQPGDNPYAPQAMGQPHVSIDGDYGVVIDVGPSYPRRQEESLDFLLGLCKAAPQLIVFFLPQIFERLGYSDLVPIAEAIQPPQVQQSLAAASGKGMPPSAMASQIQALTAQNQQLQQALQQIALKLQTKQIETQGKIDVEKLMTIRELAVEALRNEHEKLLKHVDVSHEANKALLDARMTAAHAVSQPQIPQGEPA